MNVTPSPPSGPTLSDNPNYLTKRRSSFYHSHAVCHDLKMRVRLQSIYVIAAPLPSGRYLSRVGSNYRAVASEVIAGASASLRKKFSHDLALAESDEEATVVFAAAVAEAWGVEPDVVEFHEISTTSLPTYRDIDLVGHQLGMTGAEVVSLIRGQDQGFSPEDPNAVLPREYAAALRLRLQEHADAAAEIQRRVSLSDVWHDRSPRWIAEAIRSAVIDQRF